MTKSNANENHFLALPVSDIDMSAELREDLGRAGLATLGDALKFDADELIARKKLSYRSLMELIEILKANRLEHLLRE